MTTRESIPLLLVALALGLTGCGEESSDEAAAVEAVIVAASKSKDPADCERFYTQEFLERIAYERGDAVKTCEELTTSEFGRPLKRVSVANVRVDDRKASAEVMHFGSNLDGQTVVVALARDGERWKIDRLVEFLDFDRARLLDGLRREVREGLPGFQDEVGTCMVGRIEGLKDEELQDLVLFRDRRVGMGIIEDCIREAEVTRQL